MHISSPQPGPYEDALGYGNAKAQEERVGTLTELNLHAWYNVYNVHYLFPIDSRFRGDSTLIREGVFRMQQFQLDRGKLKAAVWLIASHCPPEELGNVKLHKILYFSDMLFFLHEGHPITGVEYLKQRFGPTARYLTSAVNELASEGKIQVNTEEYYGLYKKNYVPMLPFDGEELSVEEKILIVEVADYVRGKSAKQISEISHNAAWEAAQMGETIPYFTALRLVPTEVTESDREWARDSARQYATERPF